MEMGSLNNVEHWVNSFNYLTLKEIRIEIHIQIFILKYI